MTAQMLMAQDIAPLTVEQTGKDAFHAMNEYHVRHLPVVQEGRLIGIVCEEDIFNHKLNDPLAKYDFSLMHRHFVRHTDHIFDVMRIMSENRLTVVPVVDESNNYVGLIALSDLLRFFAQSTSLTEPGSVIVLEISRRDYSLALLARVVEEENAKILAAFVTSSPDSERLEITLKLSTQNLGRVLAALTRYEYDVKYTFTESDYTDALRERYESLMTYLNV
jgi:CBS domain-containing protein